MKSRYYKSGSKKISLSNHSVKTTYSLSRLVYSTFNTDFDTNDKTLLIGHKDETLSNCELDNLYVFKRFDKNDKSNMFVKKMLESRKVKCITTNKLFNSIKEAEKFYNIPLNNGNISRCCNGELKSAGTLKDGTKLIWEYVY